MATPLGVGDEAPDLPLLLPDGSAWTPPWVEGRTTIVDFHRHLA